MSTSLNPDELFQLKAEKTHWLTKERFLGETIEAKDERIGKLADVISVQNIQISRILQKCDQLLSEDAAA